jgi:hypothetical protein
MNLKSLLSRLGRVEKRLPSGERVSSVEWHLCDPRDWPREDFPNGPPPLPPSEPDPPGTPKLKPDQPAPWRFFRYKPDGIEPLTRPPPDVSPAGG